MKYLVPMLALSLALGSPAPLFAQATESYEDFLGRGSEAFQRGDLETALLLFTRAQQLHDHPRVRLSIARIHEQLGECAAAKANYLMLIESKKAAPEIRQKAGTELESLSECGRPAEVEYVEPETPPVVEVIVPPPRRNVVRAVSVSMVGFGLMLTVGGAVVASGVFLSRAVRRCHGLGSTLDDQVAACEELAMVEDAQFWEAHVLARNQVETQRLIAATLLTAGLVAASTGAALLLTVRSEKKRVTVGLGPGSIALRLVF